MWNAGLSESQGEIKSLKEISASDMQMIPLLTAEIEEELKSLLMRLKEESEKACLEASGSGW